MDYDAFTLRNDIIGKVQSGELSPDEAEAQAERIGLGPFARTPCPNDFKPFALESWTLPMAIAWIAWRTPAAVCEQWEEFKEERHYWMWREWRVGFEGPVRQSFFLETPRRATVAMLQLSETYDHVCQTGCAPRLPIEAAIKQLWEKLSRNLVRVSGVDVRTSERRYP